MTSGNAAPDDRGDRHTEHTDGDGNGAPSSEVGSDASSDSGDSSDNDVTPTDPVRSSATPGDAPVGSDAAADPGPVSETGDGAGDGAGTDAATLNFRTSEERARSVYRLANPWYRRLARGLIATCIVAALAVGAYFGARAIQNWVDRDQLPSAGLDTPDIRESTFLLEASNSSITLEGTLTFDVRSGAFEFVGSPGGPNADDWLSSPDGGTVYAKTTDSRWRRLADDDELVATVRRAMAVLSRSDDADAILTSRLRRGFVDLDDEVEEGSGPTRRTRYDIRLELDRFADDYPLQWSNFANDIAPGIRASQDYPLSFWLDDEHVLVRVDIPAAGWSWDRLAYSDREFEAVRPPADLVVEPDVAVTELRTCRSGDAEFSTSLDCDQARLIGRQLAVAVGLVEAGDDGLAEQTFVEVCAAAQGAAPETDLVDDDTRALAELLSDSGVCPGDPDLIRP